MTDTVRIIHDQLLELGIARLGRRLMFVAWSPDTLKVSRGLNGVLITYNRGTDLYDVTEYHECTTRELANGVYAENLLDVIRPVLTARVTRAAGRNTHTREELHTREPGAGDVAPAKAPAGRSNRKGESRMSHTRATSRQATCYPKNQTTPSDPLRSIGHFALCSNPPRPVNNSSICEVPALGFHPRVLTITS